MPDYRKKEGCLTLVNANIPLVNDVIQVIWLLFQQHRNQIPFLRLTVSQSKIENDCFHSKRN